MLSPVFAKKTPAVYSAMLISFNPYPHIQCWGIKKRNATACEINARFRKDFRALPSTLNEGDRGKYYMISWQFSTSGFFFANTGTIITFQHCRYIDDARYPISGFHANLYDNMQRAQTPEDGLQLSSICVYMYIYIYIHTYRRDQGPMMHIIKHMCVY